MHRARVVALGHADARLDGERARERGMVLAHRGCAGGAGRRNAATRGRDVTQGEVGIGQRLFEEMKPQWLRIGGYWYPRGGIPIDVFWQSSESPKGLWLPDQGVAPYRGRG